MEGMWRILQQDKTGRYVLATNETHTVREFVERAFAEVGIEIIWQGSGVDEKGIDKATGKVLVDINQRYFRPAEVDLLWGDATKAEKELGWKRKVDFAGLVKMMVAADVEKTLGMSLKNICKTKEVKTNDGARSQNLCCRAQRHGRQCNCACAAKRRL